MLDEELCAGKMAVLGCHNQWSLRGERRGRIWEDMGGESKEGEKRERGVEFQLVVHMFGGGGVYM